MITALVSMISGLVSGSAPGLIKEWQAGREHKRETAMLNIQTELQIKLANLNKAARVGEMDHEMDLARSNSSAQLEQLDRKIEMVGYESQTAIAKASMKPTGIAWVDAWNASMRPFAVTIIIILFAIISGCYTYGVLFSDVDMQAASELLWGSLIGESIQAVLGFLFGYRSARK